MHKLVRIGDRWFDRQGFSLTPTTAPENIETAEFFDATSMAAELDALGVDSMNDKVNAQVAAYEDARQATKSGGTAELKAAHEAQLPAAIGTFLRTERHTAMESLGDAPEAVKPNTPEPPPETPASGGDEGGDDSDAGDGADAGEEGGDDAPVEVPNDLSGLDAAQLQGAMAAAAMFSRKDGVSPSQMFNAFLPEAPKTEETAPATEAAVFVAAANKSVQAGAAMTDMQLAEEISRWARGAKAGRSASSEVLGSYLMYGQSPTLVASGDGKGVIDAGELADFHQRRAGHHGITAAAPDRCGPNDVRRTVPDCGDTSSPLLNALQSYPAPHCKLEYYRDISLASVSDGITVWDSTARTAYQTALDDWRATPNATNLAALKAAEKQCAIAGCPTTDEVEMLPIAACLEYPNDLEYCSPESIRAHRRALDRLFVRERTANMLAVVATLSATVTADAAAAPFVNAETDAVQLGARAVVDYICRSLKPLGVTAERTTQGNYSLIVPYGLQAMLELDDELAWGMDRMGDAFGVNNVITTLDVATGGSQPYGAVPAAGSTTAFTALRAPTDWDLYMLDLDDFFEISRPDIELGAQVTPETIRGNMVFGGFMESFAGYGKDGCHPSWVISLSNLVYNGARPDRMGLAGLLE